LLEATKAGYFLFTMSNNMMDAEYLLNKQRVIRLEKGPIQTNFLDRKKTMQSEAVFLNVYGAKELIPRNEFLQPM
jgi:hypothetical protein